MTPYLKMHKSITTKRLIRAVKDEMFGTANPGFCTHCGRRVNYCEPDATDYKCEHCGHPTVFGAAYLLEQLG